MSFADLQDENDCNRLDSVTLCVGVTFVSYCLKVANKWVGLMILIILLVEIIRFLDDSVPDDLIF